ncbi:MAG: hypothetical protein IPI42_06745 [Saprospiraceae bacterium]|nr:hypothetical protein [Candidatus Parvibacillus calidus]
MYITILTCSNPNGGSYTIIGIDSPVCGEADRQVCDVAGRYLTALTR